MSSDYSYLGFEILENDEHDLNKVSCLMTIKCELHVYFTVSVILLLSLKKM